MKKTMLFASLLLISGFSLNVLGVSPEEQKKLNEQLVDAIKQADITKIQQALGQGADINATGQIHDAIRIRDTAKAVEVIKFLLKQTNININLQDWLGETALHKVAATSQARIAENAAILALLLNDPNIDVNVKDRRGNTPLHHAVNASNLPGIKMLLSKSGIDTTIKNRDNETPFDIILKKINTSYKKDRLKFLDHLYEMAKQSNNWLKNLGNKLGIEDLTNKKMREHFANKVFDSDDFAAAAIYLNSGWPIDLNKAKALYDKARLGEKHQPANQAYIKAYTDYMLKHRLKQDYYS